MDPFPEKSLDQLVSHECAVVVGVDGNDGDSERLKAMGVCTGRTIEVIKPGDPLVLKVYGARLGLSARLARRIRVTACDSGTCGH